MWFLVDLIILAIIALCVFLGYKRGLIKVLLRLATFVLALIISLILYKPISNFIINNTPLYDTIEHAIVEKLDGSTLESGNLDSKDVGNTSQVVVNYINEQAQEIKTTGVQAVAENLATGIINIITIIVLFIIVKLILMVLSIFTDILAKLPIIKQFNKLGGFIYGILEGFLITYAVLAIISLVAPVTDITNITNMIHNSIIGNIMYNNNILLMLFLK